MFAGALLELARWPSTLPERKSQGRLNFEQVDSECKLARQGRPLEGLAAHL